MKTKIQRQDAKTSSETLDFFKKFYFPSKVFVNIFEKLHFVFLGVLASWSLRWCCLVFLIFSISWAASTPVPSVDSAFDAAGKALDQSKEEVQKFKDVWDKTRLETTLYDQRAKRAYKRWTKAVKGAKETAKEQKEKAELEFQLAVEKRKLAYNEWQAAQLRMMARESQVRALDQDKDSDAVREKIKQLEEKISPPPSAVRPQLKSTPTTQD